MSKTIFVGLQVSKNLPRYSLWSLYFSKVEWPLNSKVSNSFKTEQNLFPCAAKNTAQTKLLFHLSDNKKPLGLAAEDSQSYIILFSSNLRVISSKSHLFFSPRKLSLIVCLCGRGLFRAWAHHLKLVWVNRDLWTWNSENSHSENVELM